MVESVTDICPDCGRDLTELNNSQWAGYCHIPLGSDWGCCLPPPTEEELARLEPILAPLREQLAAKLARTLDLVIQYRHLIDVILEEQCHSKPLI